MLEYYGPNPHFHVIITNVTDKPQNVWREWCSWGYYGLSFEFNDEAGKTWTVHKGPQSWSKNFPDWWTIGAHESLVLDVYFGDADTWDGFPKPERVSQVYKVRAVLAFKPDDESRQHSVWTGRIVSEFDEYEFYK